VNTTSGLAPLAVQFTDASTGTGPLTYAWDFDNNGVTDSASQNPTYTYPTAGTYTVNLTVTNAGGNDSEVKTNYITVGSSYTITASAGANGAISPSGVLSVASGATPTYTITPNTGYHVGDVLVNGTSVGAVTSYVFPSVTTNMTISATFAINTYTITAPAGANGAVTPAGVTTVNYGATPTYIITPNTGYHVGDVLVNGTSVGAVTSYTFPSVTTNMTISATFAINTYTITVNYNNKGSVTTSPPATPVAVPNGGTVTVTYGSSQTFYFKADASRQVSSITDNGVTVYTGPSANGATITYTVTNVIANHNIVATFM
jgi:hypothetical protein